MRQIKFRAQDIASNKWLYGDLRHHKDDVCIFEQEGNKGEQVKRDTIGQFVGLKDKNGKEIYEGDILHEGDPTILYQVVWRDCGLQGKQVGSNSYIGLTHGRDCLVVIGNIHDNPELINRED